MNANDLENSFDLLKSLLNGNHLEKNDLKLVATVISGLTLAYEQRLNEVYPQ